MIFCDGICDMVQQRCFASARWCNNQTALAHAQRRHQVHDPRRVTIRHGLELDFFVRIDGGQFFKWADTLIFRRLFAIDREKLHQLWAPAAAPGFAVDPHPVAQGETTDNFRRDENILRRLHKVAFRIAQESEAFARNFNDTFAKLRLCLNLLAVFGLSLSRRGGA